MAATREAQLRKIRGLLAKAEDPACTPEEAELFSKKAEELLVRYGIDRAMAEASGKGKAARGKPTSKTVPMVAPYKMPKVQLLFQIADASGVKMVMFGRSHSTLVGFESDLEAVDMLYTSLLLQVSNAMRPARRNSGRTGEDLVTFTNSFIEGFARTVGQRLRAMRQTAVAETGEKGALVLASRSDEVEDAFKELFPNTRTVRRRTRTDYDGYAGGSRAGQTADLGGSKVGTGRAGAIAS